MTKNNKLRAIVDSREAVSSPSIVEGLKKFEIDILIDKLEFGDYYIPPFLVERKSISNFLQSIRSGQLWKQVDGMKRTENVITAILIEGSLAWVQKFRDFNISSVIGVLNSLRFEWKSELFYSPNKFWTTILLFRLAKTFQSEKEIKIHPIRTVRKDLSLPEIQRGVLEGIPLIGPSHTISLLKNGKTIRNLANMRVDELMQIKGIGENRAKKIYRVFNEVFLTPS